MSDRQPILNLYTTHHPCHADQTPDPDQAAHLCLWRGTEEPRWERYRLALQAVLDHERRLAENEAGR